MKNKHYGVMEVSNRVLGWQLTGGFRAGIQGVSGLCAPAKINRGGMLKCWDWTKIAGIAVALISVSTYYHQKY